MNADRILVLDHGSIIESGNHQTLLAQNAQVAIMQSIPAVKGRLGPDGELAHAPTRRRLRETLVALEEAVAEHAEWLAGRR